MRFNFPFGRRRMMARAMYAAMKNRPNAANGFANTASAHGSIMETS